MMKKAIKIVSVILISLSIYILIINFSGVYPLFDNFPWIRPILVIIIIALLYRNVKRDFLKKK